jgi:hypothetical protein
MILDHTIIFLLGELYSRVIGDALMNIKGLFRDYSTTYVPQTILEQLHKNMKFLQHPFKCSDNSTIFFKLSCVELNMFR